MQKSICRKFFVFTITFLFVISSFASAFNFILDNRSRPVSGGNWLYVGGNGPGNYTKIQDAIDNAMDGDTVFVYDDSSPYKEKVIVDKSIKLIGENRNSTIIESYGKIIFVNAGKVQISDFTIQQYGIRLSSGIFVSSSSSETIISDNIIKGLGYGIIILSSNNTIYGNFIINNYEGIVLASENKFSSSNNTIYRNEIAYSKSYSIVLELSYSNKIYENNFKRKISMSTHIYWIYDMVYYIKYPLKRNQWYNNYWDKPRLGPKLIPGELIWPLTKFMYLMCPWYQFDWHPAKQPYEVSLIAI